jgi:hypothetical protein
MPTGAAAIPTGKLLAAMQLRPPTTEEDIRRQFKALALKVHPDRNNGSAESTNAFQALVEVRDELLKRLPASGVFTAAPPPPPQQPGPRVESTRWDPRTGEYVRVWVHTGQFYTAYRESSRPRPKPPPAEGAYASPFTQEDLERVKRKAQEQERAARRQREEEELLRRAEDIFAQTYRDLQARRERAAAAKAAAQRVQERRKARRRAMFQAVLNLAACYFMLSVASDDQVSTITRWVAGVGGIVAAVTTFGALVKLFSGK